MLFEPQTELERRLVLAHSSPTDAKAYKGFVQELVNTMVGALGRLEPGGFEPLVLSPTGTAGVCVFSHPVRYDTFVVDVMLPGSAWAVRPERARRLFGWAAGNGLFVLLNPGSRFSKDFPPFELDRLLRGEWL